VVRGLVASVIGGAAATVIHSGPVGAQACTTDDECGPCASCYDGFCGGDCSQSEYCCSDQCIPLDACCDDSDCGPCSYCDDGTCYGECSQSQECCGDQCVPFGECCVPFGEECGQVVIVEDGSQQLDCCDGLVCCEAEGDEEASALYCAECCGDQDCPNGSICCAGVCREIECCIDDILVGLDPNRRCPSGCGCFEGICVDEHQNACGHCYHDRDCPEGTCCCHDGTCSGDCCGKGCQHDTDCGKDTCCCNDGTCSHTCCDVPVHTLPSTGTGSDAVNAGALGAAALGAAAYLAARRIRDEETEEA
jgi:LPXTG-motif cell wall-anchored protein